jgi:hypothetical protein
MIEQILCSKTPINFNHKAFAQWHIPTNIGYDEPVAGPQGGVTVISDHNSQDAQDAVQKLTDELYKQPLWWIPEILPLKYMYQTQEDGWKATWW